MAIGKYLLKKFAGMIIMLFIVSIVTFILIQLPPGDYLSTYMAQLSASGEEVSIEVIEAMREQYGLDKSKIEQYFVWMGNILLRGDFGISFNWKMPVVDLLGSRMLITVVLSVLTLIFTYVTSILTGIYSAVKQYSVLDYVFTIVAFIGMSAPNFILTLIMVYGVYSLTGSTMTGLFSPEFVDAPWSLARFWDMMKHFPMPVVLCGVSGMASTFRITRGCMLDELDKTYVTAARARGVAEGKILLKYPTWLTLNPVVSTIGWVLPGIISGGTIVAIILNLPTVAPILLEALKTQDMYLAGAIVMFLSALTILGMFISDVMLMFIDPRIRIEG